MRTGTSPRPEPLAEGRANQGLKLTVQVNEPLLAGGRKGVLLDARLPAESPEPTFSSATRTPNPVNAAFLTDKLPSPPALSARINRELSLNCH